MLWWSSFLQNERRPPFVEATRLIELYAFASLCTDLSRNRPKSPELQLAPLNKFSADQVQPRETSVGPQIEFAAVDQPKAAPPEPPYRVIYHYFRCLDWRIHSNTDLQCHFYSGRSNFAFFTSPFSNHPLQTLPSSPLCAQFVLLITVCDHMRLLCVRWIDWLIFTEDSVNSEVRPTNCKVQMVLQAVHCTSLRPSTHQAACGHQPQRRSL